MQIVHGLISSDSHAQPDRKAFVDRMSAKWGDAIPQVRETSDPAHMAVQFDYPVERWFVNGHLAGNRGVANCPTVMDDPLRKTFPQRWDEVPESVYDPHARLSALDQDAIDAEVLFPNEPALGGTFFQYSAEADFELACVRAYNDQLAEWATVSDRYVPLAVIPYLSDPKVIAKEIERSVSLGHRGITMLAEPSQVSRDLPHFNDPHWCPIWEVCQALDVPVHWHVSAGVRITMPVWDGLTRNQAQAAVGVFGFSAQAQTVPNLIFSGILQRFPRLKWVCAESGLGWVLYILEACDHEWERRRLWTCGMPDRPSELFHRQIFVDFWYEKVGIELREVIGVDNIMWESDYPHSTSTFPESWDFVDRTLEGVPDADRHQMICGNAIRLYKLDAELSAARSSS